MAKDIRKQVVIKLQNDEYEKLLAAADARGTSLYKFCLESMRRDLLGIQTDTQSGIPLATQVASQPAPKTAIDPEALTTLVDTRVAELMAQQVAPPAVNPDVAALAETVAALVAEVAELKKPDGAIAI